MSLLSHPVIAAWETRKQLVVALPSKFNAWKGAYPAALASTLQIAAAANQANCHIIACYNSCTTSQEQEKYINKFINYGGTQDEISLVPINFNDTWLRDTCPLINTNGDYLSYNFNGWGNKFAHELDATITAQLFEKNILTNNCFSSQLTTEGGAMEHDGNGTIMFHHDSLYNKNRYPHLSTTKIIQHVNKSLQQNLKVKHKIILRHGHLAGDDTDNHIDMLARFINPKTIAYSDPDLLPQQKLLSAQLTKQNTSLRHMRDELLQAKQQNNESYQLIALPLPQTIINNAGTILPANYANFLILNNIIIVPSYNDRADDFACNILAKAFNNKQIIPCPASGLIAHGGSIHCASWAAV